MQCSVESEGDDDGGDNCYPAGGVAVDGGEDTKIVKLIYILSCWLPVFTFLKVCTSLVVWRRNAHSGGESIKRYTEPQQQKEALESWS